jgi:uncharacterized membrane protein YeaQ/YmgE (transglycosylase-associated protein family)
MIAMSFSSFLTLFVISAVCAFVLHLMLNFKLLRGGEGYLCELIAGWIGAWIGSPVLGYWSWMVPSTRVYLVPAIIGSVAAIYTLVASVRIIESVLAPLSVRETTAFPNERTRIA